MTRPFVAKNQVVFDKEQNEYVNFRLWVHDADWRADVFNPRCGETYTTTIRLLTVRELGAYTD